MSLFTRSTIDYVKKNDQVSLNDAKIPTNFLFDTLTNTPSSLFRTCRQTHSQSPRCREKLSAIGVKYPMQKGGKIPAPCVTFINAVWAFFPYPFIILGVSAPNLVAPTTQQRRSPALIGSISSSRSREWFAEIICLILMMSRY